MTQANLKSGSPASTALGASPHCQPGWPVHACIRGPGRALERADCTCGCSHRRELWEHKPGLWTSLVAHSYLKLYASSAGVIDLIPGGGSWDPTCGAVQQPKIIINLKAWVQGPLEEGDPEALSSSSAPVGTWGRVSHGSRPLALPNCL